MPNPYVLAAGAFSHPRRIAKPRRLATGELRPH
jgi:hypothetical protein